MKSKIVWNKEKSEVCIYKDQNLMAVICGVISKKDFDHNSRTKNSLWLTFNEIEGTVILSVSEGVIAVFKTNSDLKITTIPKLKRRVSYIKNLKPSYFESIRLE